MKIQTIESIVNDINAEIAADNYADALDIAIRYAEDAQIEAGYPIDDSSMERHIDVLADAGAYIGTEDAIDQWKIECEGLLNVAYAIETESLVECGLDRLHNALDDIGCEVDLPDEPNARDVEGAIHWFQHDQRDSRALLLLTSFRACGNF